MDKEKPLVKKALNYIAEPTAAAFHASDKWVRVIIGPYGSGKTVAAAMDLFSKACSQRAITLVRHGRVHKVRKTAWAIVRSTYPELRTTVLKTWLEWFDEWTTTVYGSPITATLKLPLQDGSVVESTLYFLAMDRPKDIKKIKSLEITGLWLNEVSEMDGSLINDMFSRVGRYPRKEDGGATWNGIIMDTNPPADDHWLYKSCEEDKPDNWAVFKQPPALIERRLPDGKYEYMPNPKAENVRHQTKGYNYWFDMLDGASRDWIQVYLLGKYGRVQSGRPVYPEYDDDKHCRPCLPNVRHGITLGWDFGLTPAVVFGQVIKRGDMFQLRVFDELSVEKHAAMGIRQFAEEVVIPYLEANYNWWVINGLVESFGDPAGNQKMQTDEMTCLMTLNDLFAPVKIYTTAASTNSFLARREAVAKYLLREITVEVPGAAPIIEPGFIIDPKCKVLRRGFNGGYSFERMQIAGNLGTRYRDVPTKNIYSHPHDALQYLSLCGTEKLDTIYGPSHFSQLEKEVKAKTSAEDGLGLLEGLTSDGKVSENRYAEVEGVIFPGDGETTYGS